MDTQTNIQDLFYLIIDIFCYQWEPSARLISNISLLDRTCNNIVRPLVTRYRKIFDKFKYKFAERLNKYAIGYPLKLRKHEYHFIPKTFLKFSSAQSIIINKKLLETEENYHYFLSNITLIMNDRRDGQAALFLYPNYISDYFYSREDFHTCGVNNAHLRHRFKQDGPVHILNLRLPLSRNQIPLEKDDAMALNFNQPIKDRILYIMLDVIKMKKEEGKVLITDITFDAETGKPIKKSFMRVTKSISLEDEYDQMGHDMEIYYQILINTIQDDNN